MLKRKPGRPPIALALAAAGQVTVHAPPPLLADSKPRPNVPLSRCQVPSGLLALAARQVGRCAYSSRWRECVASHADGWKNCENHTSLCSDHCCHGQACTSPADSPRTISVSTSWVHQFVDRKLNWSFWVSRVGASCGIACAEGSTDKPKASQKKTAKGASNEGSSMTIGRRRGSSPSSKNMPRIGHAVMQKAEAQAKAKA
eukprot:148213-Chlamydomonas_euryale.AAC.3